MLFLLSLKVGGSRLNHDWDALPAVSGIKDRQQKKWFVFWITTAMNRKGLYDTRHCVIDRPLLTGFLRPVISSLTVFVIQWSYCWKQQVLQVLTAGNRALTVGTLEKFITPKQKVHHQIERQSNSRDYCHSKHTSNFSRKNRANSNAQEKTGA
jgi:hypothetical protein